MTRFAVDMQVINRPPVWRSFAPRCDQREEWAGLKRLAPHLLDGPCWAFMESGAPVAFGGLMAIPARPHAAEAWSVIGRPSRSGYGRMIAWARDHLPLIAKAEGFTRLETRARADIPGAAATLERIGFTREGLHPRAAPSGADEYSYGWLMEG